MNGDEIVLQEREVISAILHVDAIKYSLDTPLSNNDSDSPTYYIQSFDRAIGVNVPHSRFQPMMSTSDLFIFQVSLRQESCLCYIYVLLVSSSRLLRLITAIAL